MDLSNGFSEIQSNVQILLKCSENSALKSLLLETGHSRVPGKTRATDLTGLEKIVKIVIK